MDSSKTSPLLEQYRRIKKGHKEEILFFRLGDFYEMFAEDAIEVTSLLNLTLTSRNGLPMCGVPYHAARAYIARLLKYGKKIAICEQLSVPGKSKLIERDVVEIITPGTTVDEDFLDKSSSNYLACLCFYRNLSFAYIDLSCGGFYATNFPKNDKDALRQELERLSIKEILVPESLLEEEAISCALNERNGLVINKWADWLFDPVKAKDRLLKQFAVATLKGFGLNEDSSETLSAGILLEYLDTTARSLLPHIKTINIYNESEYLGIDESSIRNLELLKNLSDQTDKYTLFEVMDDTKTAMGKRLLKRQILHPLRDIEKINKRLDKIEELYNDQNKLNKLRDILAKTPDLERLISRLAMDKANGRDMISIKNALFSFQAIQEIYISDKSIPGTGDRDQGSGSLSEGNDCCEQDKITNISPSFLVPNPLSLIKELLEKSITEEPSVVLNEGNLIKQGYNEELDKLKDLQNNARQILEAYLEEEKEATGISNLKIRYNRLIGYYFEVTKAHVHRVPGHFIRRQGIAGGERYSTDKLASLESEINSAENKVIELEKELFLEIRETVKKEIKMLASLAGFLAELDTAQGLAKAAQQNNWVRPFLDYGKTLEIHAGRHPVVEAHLARGEYIPNDIYLSDAKGCASFAMITGPNMAGKSTYLRSAALITIMAQAGSFVPASKASIGICDRIYCRVGASDNLARGESTFLVEMNETAFILNTATDKSLVIMDEVGRGTATNDGLSIAWAVSEELLNRVRCRTLFATHFHELSLLSHPKLANRSMEVLEKGDKIIFLRRLKEGPAAESYGIHVAKLAGISQPILKRAGEIMALLKERDKDLSKTFLGEKKVQPGEQLSLFD